MGSLSNTQQEGLISLLLNQDQNEEYKDSIHIKNWRPLTLMCCDVKILTKCIALQIKNVLASIIHFDQSGFTQGL